MTTPTPTSTKTTTTTNTPNNQQRPTKTTDRWTRSGRARANRSPAATIQAAIQGRPLRSRRAPGARSPAPPPQTDARPSPAPTSPRASNRARRRRPTCSVYVGGSKLLWRGRTTRGSSIRIRDIRQGASSRARARGQSLRDGRSSLSTRCWWSVRCCSSPRDRWPGSVWCCGACASDWIRWVRGSGCCACDWAVRGGARGWRVWDSSTGAGGGAVWNGTCCCGCGKVWSVVVWGICDGGDAGGGGVVRRSGSDCGAGGFDDD